VHDARGENVIAEENRTTFQAIIFIIKGHCNREPAMS